MSFADTVKHELESLDTNTLPLDQCTAQGGYVDESPIAATILSSQEYTDYISVKAGIFFTEIVINCGCGEDPMPTNAYAEVSIRIDKITGDTTFSTV